MTSNAAGPASGKIRVGLIGVGNWANHGHLRVRSAVSRAASDIDLVAVLNTAPQHAETVRAVIAAGKDVYCEWPLTVSTSIAEALVVEAQRAGVQTVTGLQRRLAPHNRFLRDLLAGGYVGKLRSVRMHVSMNYFQATRSPALKWTVPEENFSSVAAIYGGHFLDMLFEAVGWPRSLSAMMINQFPEVTIAGSGETIATSAPDQFLLTGMLDASAVLTVQIEGGKRNGSGVQIDITGDQGDIRITNASAFGDAGDDYVVSGAHGDDLPLQSLPIPETFNWLPPSGLPSSVLELANLYAAFARDRATGGRQAPTFEDALRLHRLFDLCALSSCTGARVDVP